VPTMRTSHLETQEEGMKGGGGIEVENGTSD